MRVAIYQPRYFPQLHYFNRMFASDLFVLLDSAQYTKALTQYSDQGVIREKSYQSDSPIQTSNGVGLLTIPVKHNGLAPINETEIDNSQKWRLKHINHLRSSYLKAPMYPIIFPAVSQLLNADYSTLADLNIATIIWAASYLLENPLPIRECSVENFNRMLGSGNLKKRLIKLYRAADVGVERPEGLHKGTEWTVAICRKLHATEYFHGGTAQHGYMDLSVYKNEGIQPVLQDWKCESYHQQFSKNGFSPNLSILDLLFNVPLPEAQMLIGIRYG